MTSGVVDCDLRQGHVDHVAAAPAVRLRGNRLARASSTDDALRTANASSALPPESISTTREPARYSPRPTDVTIDIPASRSEPNSPEQLPDQVDDQEQPPHEQADEQRKIADRDAADGDI